MEETWNHKIFIHRLSWKELLICMLADKVSCKITCILFLFSPYPRLFLGYFLLSILIPNPLDEFEIIVIVDLSPLNHYK